jgi:hypothetical protein
MAEVVSDACCDFGWFYYSSRCVLVIFLAVVEVKRPFWTLQHPTNSQVSMPKKLPTTNSSTIGQQLEGPALQADTVQIQLPVEHGQVQLMDSETNERESEDNSTGRQTSGRVRKRTQVDGSVSVILR